MYFSVERSRRIAEHLLEHLRNGTTDMTSEIMELDLDEYRNEELAQMERERIFERLPMMAAHASRISEPNSYITAQTNRSNVLLTRQKDGSVGAFLNVCRHRGASLVNDTGGRRAVFTCPYHAWSYGNDGSIRNIPYSYTFGASACERSGLVALPVEERHGFIWVVEDPRGTIDVADHLGPGMDQLLSELPFDQWFHYKDHTFEFPQNWKVMMDGLIDGYHVQFLHGKTISPYFQNNTMATEIHGNHALTATPRRTLADVSDQETIDHHLHRYAIFATLVTPSSVLVMHPHHVEFWTIYQHPLATDRARVCLRYLTPERDHDEEGERTLEKNWKIATDAIINEDVPVGNSIQKSATTPHAGPICLGRNEILNQLFHRSYQRYMGNHNSRAYAQLNEV